MRQVNLKHLCDFGYDYIDLEGEALLLAHDLHSILPHLPFTAGYTNTEGLDGAMYGKPNCIAYEKIEQAPIEAQLFWRYIKNSPLLVPYRNDFQTLELSFAHYSVGQGLSQHNDLDGSSRSLNLALYLSREWKGGGVLQMTKNGELCGEVEPIYGRLAIILNDPPDFLHGITETESDRYVSLCRFS